MPTGDQQVRPTWRGAVRAFLHDWLGPGHGVVERRIPCSGNQGRRVILIERHKIISYLTWTGPSAALGTLTYATDSGEPVEIDRDGFFIISISHEKIIPIK